MTETANLETGCVSPPSPVVPPKRYYIAIDLETTGLCSWAHGICQIGAVASNDRGDIVSTFVTDVGCLSDRRGAPVSKEALEVNGFTLARIFAAPYEEDAFIRFLKWKDSFSMSTPTAIFHNAPFDVGFLKEAFRRYDLDAGRFLRRVRDTATMTYDVDGEDAPRSLEEICKRHNIEKLNNHDALHDALATHHAFWAMKTILDQRRPLTLTRINGYGGLAWGGNL